MYRYNILQSMKLESTWTWKSNLAKFKLYTKIQNVTWQKI